VEAALGIALGIDGVDALTLTDVELVGPVGAANAGELPSDVTPFRSATYGLVVLHTRSAALEDVNVHGFAKSGALFVDSDTRWTRGAASDNLGGGLIAVGGKIALAELEISRTLQGFRIIPAYSAAFIGGADVETTNLSIANSEGYGILHDGGSGRHAGISLHDNGDAALWAQHATSLEVSGTIARNRFAGVVAVDSSNISIHDSTIDGSILTPRVLEETGSISVGDGVQLVRPSGITSLKKLELHGNERVGVLVDLDGQTLGGMVLDDVRVYAEGEALGVVMQGGTAPSGWDANVNRTGATSERDAMAAGTLPSVEVVGPCERPRDSDIGSASIESLAGI
jgi:hypothetical protein